MQKFKIIGREKYVHGRRKEEERIMPSLVATMSALARTMCVRTHYVRTKNYRFWHFEWFGQI